MATYHRDVGSGIPEDVVVPYGQVYLSPSGHAVAEAQNDRYLRGDEDSLIIPRTIQITPQNVFEVETDDGGNLKVCVRTEYDETRDIIYAVLLDGAICDPMMPCTLKTVWINVVDDSHETLDASVYDND